MLCRHHYSSYFFSTFAFFGGPCVDAYEEDEDVVVAAPDDVEDDITVVFSCTSSSSRTPPIGDIVDSTVGPDASRRGSIFICVPSEATTCWNNGVWTLFLILSVIFPGVKGDRLGVVVFSPFRAPYVMKNEDFAIGQAFLNARIVSNTTSSSVP